MGALDDDCEGGDGGSGSGSMSSISSGGSIPFNTCRTIVRPLCVSVFFVRLLLN